MIPEDIHLKIRAVRRDMDLSQDYVAKKLGVEQQTISDIELGKKPITDELLDKISSILGVAKEHIISKDYIQPIQINNNHCTGNVGYNNVTVTNDGKIIEEVRQVIEKMNSSNLKTFEEILAKIFDHLKKK